MDHSQTVNERVITLCKPDRSYWWSIGRAPVNYPDRWYLIEFLIRDGKLFLGFRHVQTGEECEEWIPEREVRPLG